MALLATRASWSIGKRKGLWELVGAASVCGVQGLVGNRVRWRFSISPAASIGLAATAIS